MKSFLQLQIKSLILGGIISIGLIFFFIAIGLVFVRPNDIPFPVYVMINLLGIILGWLVTSFLIEKFSVYVVLGLVALLVIVSVSDLYITVEKNPITIPGIILFWLGVAYLIVPEFFKKYRVLILTVYGLFLSYFFFDFKTTPNYVIDDRAQFARLMTFPIPVFAALWLFEQWRWLKNLQADKGKAELALLKSQINPHFFFNTLNNLYGLVIEKSDKAPDVILKLSDMMRYTIYEGKEELVLLKNEISYLENYIELHKIRYQKRVNITFTHQVEGDLKVAPLLFINLLENAFKHGAEKMRAQAFINLNMQSQGKQLFFTIENNFDESTPNSKPGIGLENLKKRLHFLYPDRHQLEIEVKDAIYKVLLNLELK